jgi:aryl-alcohol dehydrogenase-like predicted oxidoreductase
LLSLKNRGLVDRLGISVYTSADLSQVPRELLDIVQLPLSLYDQRLLNDGTIDILASNKTAIHARSVFLQGLLLTSASNWPNWLSPEVINHHCQLESFAHERNCELIDLAIGFARVQESLEAIVIGICNGPEFKQLMNAWSRPNPWLNHEWERWSLNHPLLLDPRLWPR